MTSSKLKKEKEKNEKTPTDWRKYLQKMYLINDWYENLKFSRALLAQTYNPSY
jgi:hypothetical protein